MVGKTKQVSGFSPELQRALDDVRRQGNELSEGILSGAVWATQNRSEEIEWTSAGQIRVYHSLGRRPLGWMVVSPNGPANVYSTQDSEDPTRALLLVSSGALICRILVF